MGRFFKDLWNKFRNENIVGKYIYANVAIYVAVAVVGVFATLFAANGAVGSVLLWFELPADFMQLLCRPWSIITYMFLHHGLAHILWNMLALYGFGRIFLSFYSTKHFVGLYLLGGISGGLFYLVAYNIFPYFSDAVGHSYLVGASAAVLAVVMAAAVRSPQYRVNLFLFGSVRLMTIAIVTVVVSFLLVTSENAGGNIAHLGGAFAGWAFAYMLNKGYDLTKFINASIDFFCTLFSGKKILKRKPKMTFTRTGKHSVDYEYNAGKKAREEELDAILDKVRKGGYSSLSDDEKRRLFEASK